MRIIKLNTPEWPYLLFGSLAGMVNGLFPFAFALVLSEILTVSRAYCGITVQSICMFYILYNVAHGM